MKILHTSDWHLGKGLNGFSRLEEQELFLKELVAVADEEDVDAVVVAGDIFDTYYPQANAEKLFYYYAKELTKAGVRPLIIIAGNHDEPRRLSASSPLSHEFGIILAETAQTVIPTGKCGQFDVTYSEEGYFELLVKGEKLSVIALPYISEKRVNKLLSDKAAEGDIKEGTNAFVAETIERLLPRLSSHTPTIAIGHFYLFGGTVSDSERGIQFGGSAAVDPSVFPEAVHYVAMGHLHKPQRVTAKTHVYYSGSPVSYSLSETGIPKKVFIADIKPPVTDVYHRLLSCPLPLVEIRGTVTEVIETLNSRNGEYYAFIEVLSQTPLSATERNDIFNAHSRIADITISQTATEQTAPEQVTLKFFDEFKAYFEYRNGVTPSDDIMRVFMEIAGGDEPNETD